MAIPAERIPKASNINLPIRAFLFWDCGMGRLLTMKMNVMSSAPPTTNCTTDMLPLLVIGSIR